jgi:hypothetical protein
VKRIPVPGKRRSNHHPRYYTFAPSSDEFIFAVIKYCRLFSASMVLNRSS